MVIFGAVSARASLEDPIALDISFKIWIRPSFACPKAISIISFVIEVILISIWRLVIPSTVPATLKSISPRWSSSPRISDKTEKSSFSLISPIAIPATGFLIGTPASIKAKEAPHTVAIDDEPFDSVTSETILTVYGKSSATGNNGCTALHANLPCPISLLPGEPTRPASPTEYGGKL